MFDWIKVNHVLTLAVLLSGGVCQKCKDCTRLYSLKDKCPKNILPEFRFDLLNDYHEWIFCRNVIELDLNKHLRFFCCSVYFYQAVRPKIVCHKLEWLETFHWEHCKFPSGTHAVITGNRAVFHEGHSVNEYEAFLFRTADVPIWEYVVRSGKEHSMFEKGTFQMEQESSELWDSPLILWWSTAQLE